MRAPTKSMLLGILSAAILAPIAQAAQAEDGKPLKIGGDVFERRVLSNGLQAFAIQEEAPTTTVFLAVSVGNRNETAATTGLAHLTEHAMFAGTPTTGTDVHEKTIVGWGGESNAYTRDDFTMYYDHEFPPATLEEVLAMEADRLVNLSLESAPVLHERHRLELEEKHSYRSAEGRAAQLEAAVFQLHPYRFGLRTPEGHTRGPQHSVATIRAFYQRHYHPNRVAVVVVGPHDPALALDAIEAAFDGLARGPVGDVISLEPVPNRGRKVLLRSTLPEDRFLSIWLTPAFGEKDRATVEVLAAMLAREELASGTALTVSMGGRTDREMLQVGWSGDASVDEEVRALLNTYRNGEIFDDPEKEKVLAEVKDLMLASHREQPLRARPYFAKAATLAAYASLGLGDAYAEWDDALEDVSAVDVVAAARTWLHRQNRIEVIFRGTGAEVLALPDDVDGLHEAAAQAAETGDFERARQAYTKLLGTNPNRMNTVIFYAERGGYAMEMRDYDAAIADFEAALKVVDYPAVRDMLEEAIARKARASRGDFSD